MPVLINGVSRQIRHISGCEETFAAVDTNGIMYVHETMACIAQLMRLDSYVWSFAPVTTGEAKPKADVYTDLR